MTWLKVNIGLAVPDPMTGQRAKQNNLPRPKAILKQSSTTYCGSGTPNLILQHV